MKQKSSQPRKRGRLHSKARSTKKTKGSRDQRTKAKASLAQRTDRAIDQVMRKSTDAHSPMSPEKTAEVLAILKNMKYQGKKPDPEGMKLLTDALKWHPW